MSDENRVPLEERAEYAALKSYKRAHQWDLLRRYGAHGIGIGWKKTGGEVTDTPALIFYVAKKTTPEETDVAIPKTFQYVPKEDEEGDEGVNLVTDVVESAPPSFEEEGEPE
ncbi:MAG: hypothetical protein MJB57_01005 [Gemmatimonadetes bacterium]|nr:hypothetical protein [Gemmatimonadota bacterium]